MRLVLRTSLHWVENRTGFVSLSKGFFHEKIPASAGWAQALGSVALFLCVIQAVTGILLSFNYAGTPGDAYNSLTYIIREIPMGKMLHGLHHWGASLLLVAVVLHMSQVFIYGAYKRPREATWISGVCLLLLVLGFSLTGYLLPWDNRAYWGTVVTTKIIGQTPLIGGYLQRVAGVTDGIGVVSFAHFYSLHILILPLSVLGLLWAHLYMVRRHGVTPLPEDSQAKVHFYPQQVFRDVAACFVAFVLLFTAAMFLQVPLERLADPTDNTYVPRPEWYFLFLFESLKFFQGSLEPVGSIGLPTLAVLALLAVPFVDRTRAVRFRQRTVAFSVVVASFAGWAALTIAGLQGAPHSVSSLTSKAQLDQAAARSFSPEEIAGLGYFRSQRCESCHNLVSGPPKPGPTLLLVGTRRSAGWIIQHFKNPSQTIPGSNMPPIRLGVPELNALSAFLLKARPETVADIESIPAQTVAGAQIFVAESCGTCHSVNGTGDTLGPKLNGLASRRSREWIERHFEDPKALSPGTTMPPFHFSEDHRKQLVDYLLALP